MIGSRTPLVLVTLLLFGSGALLLLLGNALAILVAFVAVLASSLFCGGTSSRSAWVCSLGAIGIFLAGTPLAGAAPEGILISAVMALYFVCFVQQLKVTPPDATSPTGPYTLTFYGTLLLAYLLLQNRLFHFPFVLAIFLASILILLSLALWEVGRRSRLAQAGQLENPTLPDWLSRACVLAALLLATFLLFRLPLPWMANNTLNMARELNLTASPPSSHDKSRRNKERTEWNSGSDPLDTSNDASNENQEGAGDTSWSRGSLPKTANLELRDLARLHLELPDQEHANHVFGTTLYVRAHTLGIYGKGGWERAEQQGRWISDEEDGIQDGWVTFGQAPPDQVIHQRLYLYHHLTGGGLLSLTNTLAFKGPQVFRQGDDFLSFRQGGDVTYDLVSAPIHYEDIVKENVLEPGDAPNHFSQKAQGVTFRDIDNLLLGRALKGDMTLKQMLRSIRQLFESEFTYSLRIDNPDNRDPLANFLFHEKAGYCDFFAQAGAHILRAVGVPSRVAYGYAGGVYDPTQDLYTFRESDAHSWTEMFLKEYGWVIFDLVPVGEGSHRAAEISQNGQEIGDPIRRFKEAEEARKRRAGESNQTSLSLMTDWEGWFEGLWVARYLDTLLGIAVLGLLLAYAVRRWRLRGTIEQEGDGSSIALRSEPPGYLKDFCALFGNRGYRRAPGQTLREYMTHLKESAQIRDEFEHLLEYHYSTNYEGGSRSKSRESGFRREIRDFAASSGLQRG
ncbi:MAG: hypothetical protein GWQ05_10290 [Verrucomicrobiaceae bacterium]|nr:hypothetical protein [Verrucomicrobiaceae bacterium]